MMPMQITSVEPLPMPAAVMVLAQCCTMKVPAISATVACGTNHCGSSANGSSSRARLKACGALGGRARGAEVAQAPAARGRWRRGRAHAAAGGGEQGVARRGCE